jgi:hypothetical protein
MTILLLVLLVIYLAVVSAPVSIRLVGLMVARNGLREPPLLEASAIARSRTSEGESSAALK